MSQDTKTIRRGIVLWTSTPPGLRLVLSREFDVEHGGIKGMTDAVLWVEKRTTDALGDPSWTTAADMLTDGKLLEILEEIILADRCRDLEADVRKELQAVTAEDSHVQ